jgi:hypothetical protein
VSRHTAASRPAIREEELFPSLPGTQEWWPDPEKFKKEEGEKVAAEGGAPASGRLLAGPRKTQEGQRRPPQEEAPGRDRRERHRQEAQEDAARERKKEARRRDEAPGPSSQPSRTPTPDPDPVPADSSPELPKVREWWGKPEEARKSPFYYLTALRQSPPGTKSWG